MCLENCRTYFEEILNKAIDPIIRARSVGDDDAVERHRIEAAVENLAGPKLDLVAKVVVRHLAASETGEDLARSIDKLLDTEMSLLKVMLEAAPGCGIAAAMAVANSV